MVRPSSAASLSGTSVTPIPVDQEAEPRPAARSRALRIAGAWLASLAVLATVALLVAWFALNPIFGGPASVEDTVRGLAWPLGAFAACGLAGVISWRAATPGRPREAAVAFTIAGVAAAVILVPGVFLLLPPDGLYGLDPYAVASAAWLPWSIAILVPAELMIVGSARQWCEAGGATTAHRRAGIVSVAALAILGPVGALVAVDAAQPACGPGRTCVVAAGISFELPGGWSRTEPESGELYAATAGSSERRFVVEDGTSVVRDAGFPTPADIDGVVDEVPAMFGEERDRLTSITGVSTQRTTLPVGPAVRVSFTAETTFVFRFADTAITEWFFVDGRLIVVEYRIGYGEGTPDNPSSDPDDFRLVLESLRGL